MISITPADVRAILPTGTTLTDLQLQSAIDASKCVIDQICLGCAAHLSDECKEQTWIYLAAHFAAVTDNSLSLQSETDACCDASATYGFKFGEGVKGTPYGQTANMLSGGCLAEQDKKPVNLFSIGCA